MKARAKAAANPSEDMMGQVRDHSGLQKLQKIMKRVGVSSTSGEVVACGKGESRTGDRINRHQINQ